LLEKELCDVEGVLRLYFVVLFGAGECERVGACACFGGFFKSNQFSPYLNNGLWCLSVKINNDPN